MHLTAESADKNGLCYRCHDEDNSPHFDFAKYYGQIVHKGLDDYKDPKVHKGRPAKVAGAGRKLNGLAARRAACYSVRGPRCRPSRRGGPGAATDGKRKFGQTGLRLPGGSRVRRGCSSPVRDLLRL